MATDVAAAALAAYAEGRHRVVDLARQAGNPGPVVPACPAWTATDLVAHLVGLAEDIASGTLDGYGSDAWTQAQVDRHRGQDIDTLAARWDETWTQLQPVLADPAAAGLPGFMAVMVTTDLIVHEHDLRAVLGRDDGRDDGVAVAVKAYVSDLRRRHGDAGLPPLLVRETDGRDWPVGTGEPAAVVSALRFELFRALAGRRTREQVRGLDWEGDPEPYLDVWLGWPFTWPSEPLAE